MRMPANIRTVFRKMLRDHPKILEYVKNKSQVNYLTRDELIKLADDLEINFLKHLSDVITNFPIMDLIIDANDQKPFAGCFKFLGEMTVLGQRQTCSFLVEYEYVPDWQFYCPNERRLKYRRQDLVTKLYSQSMKSEEEKEAGKNVGFLEWKPLPEAIRNFINPNIFKELSLKVEQEAWELDQARRENAQFPTRGFVNKRSHNNASKNNMRAVSNSVENKLSNQNSERENCLVHRAFDKQNPNDVNLEFLAIASHEIRTPMTSVIGLADLLLDTNLRCSQRDKVEKIKGTVEGLVPILNGILDFSKIQSGKLEFENIDFDIHLLITEITELMYSRAAAKGLVLSLDIAPDLGQGFHSDPTRVRQILMNFLENAVKFTAQGGISLKVEVESQQRDRLILKFGICDTGIGIAEKRHEKLFESYTQMDASITRKYEGTGLGLAIAKRLIESLGGQVGFNSREGRGSKFWFTIVGKAVSTEDLKMSRGSNLTDYSAARQLRVLLAEDNDLNRMIVKSILSKFGHSVFAVEDGSAAVDAALDGGYDLILMDVRMPRMDGVEAARAIRRARNDKAEVPIIAITADATEKTHERYSGAGMNECITKPINVEELLEAINKVLGERVHIGRQNL